MSDGPTGINYPSEPTSTGPTGTISTNELVGGTAPSPPIILLSDLLADVSVLQKKEADDKAKFVAVTNPDLVGFRTKLIAWITGGYAGNCDLIQIPLSIPPTCSDGVARTMIDYVEYVSGVSLVNHLASIQAILPDFEVAYRCSRTELVFCVVTVKF